MRKVLLFLAQGFESSEASAFVDVLGWNQIDGDGSTTLYTCGFRREVTGSFNQRYQVDFLINEIDYEDFDALVIPGGLDEFGYFNDAYREELLRLIRIFNAQNKPIAATSVGSLPVARSGVLINRRATTYNKRSILQAELAGYEVNVINQPIVRDWNIITSWNPSTAFEVAFQLLENLTSKNQANFIREIMGFVPVLRA